MKKIITGFIAIGLCGCGTHETSALRYPETKTVDSVDVYFGEAIPDPYRWLEDDLSKETAAWVKSQNQVTFNYLSQIPYRKALENRLEQLWNYEKMSIPFRRGSYTYFFKNNGLQNQDVLYRKDEQGKEALFLDPNTFSKDGTTSLSSLHFSEDASLLAYQISEGGSDWKKIIVIRTADRQIVGDTLINIKFGEASWKGNEGFFYSSYEKPQGSFLSAKTDHHKLYYHRLGTPQQQDEIVFGNANGEKYRFISGEVTKDQRFLVISCADATSGNKLFIKRLDNINTPALPVTEDSSFDTSYVENQEDLFFFLTNVNAPNRRLVQARLSALTPEHWSDVIPETENVLSVSKANHYFFAKYLVDATSQIRQYDYNGNLIRSVKLPEVGTAGGFNGDKDQTVVYFTFSNYATPTCIYTFDTENGTPQKYWAPNIDFDSSLYQSEQIFYTSKDGTKIPMIITYKKGMQRNGKNPTILYGYGGFNISLTPRFNVAQAVWLEQGGIYAVANLRGGGEYGKNWHLQGTKLHKQNVFDDFIAAAEYLQSHQYTSRDYLAISGASNGGLLVGATLTQRPDLMKVALPGVGVMDMLRYHKFTAGAAWAYDYGTSQDSPEMFSYLKSYSPVHNVKKGVHYPATLITTGDHDDRVVPAHSYKFAAELQSKQSGTLPVLIRIETNAGHGAGTPVKKRIEQAADMASFTLWNMGFHQLPHSYDK